MILKDILVSVVVPILTALISFLGARHQANKDLEKVKEQQRSELERLREQQGAELQKIKEQQQAEMEKMKLQQQAEIEKIKAESAREIDKITTELEKQAELYEKNAQTDVMRDFMGKTLTDNEDVRNMVAAAVLQGIANGGNGINPGAPQKQGRSYPPNGRK